MLLNMLHRFCRLRECFVRAEDTDKLFFDLGAERLHSLTIKRFILTGPLRRLEDILESGKIWNGDELD